MCKSHRSDTADQHCSVDSGPPLQDAPTHTLQVIGSNSFLCFGTFVQPGRSGLPVYPERSGQLGQTGHVARLQSSLCQILQIFHLLPLLPRQHALPDARSCVPHRKTVINETAVCVDLRLKKINKPFFSYSNAPAAFLCRATGPPRRISHPAREGRLRGGGSPRPDL